MVHGPLDFVQLEGETVPVGVQRVGDVAAVDVHEDVEEVPALVAGQELLADQVGVVQRLVDVPHQVQQVPRHHALLHVHLSVVDFVRQGRVHLLQRQKDVAAQSLELVFGRGDAPVQVQLFVYVMPVAPDVHTVSSIIILYL